MKSSIMPRVQLHSHAAGVEPAPAFASDAEIALAEQLRHELEKRYLGSPATPLPMQASGEDD